MIRRPVERSSRGGKAVALAGEVYGWTAKPTASAIEIVVIVIIIITITTIAIINAAVAAAAIASNAAALGSPSGLWPALKHECAASSFHLDTLHTKE
jgi:hypothetical protein